MSVTPWVSAPTLISNGQDVSQEVINPVLLQLVQREQHLYELFQEMINKGVLQSFSVPIHPDELSASSSSITPGALTLTYYSNDVNGQGLRPTSVSFAFNSSKSTFSPSDSAYTYGITSGLNGDGTANLWIQGLVNLPLDIDDISNGLIQKVSSTAVETFEVGPYYMSRTSAGKITKSPGGIAIFVGYAIDKRNFLLAPNTDEFSQYFINYRYNVLDRPTATPVLTSTTWTVPNSTMNRLGWVDIAWLQSNNPSALAGYTIPSNAKFYYNVPAVYTTDNADNSGAGSLTDFEETQASELIELLPPHPSNFVEYEVNGITQVFYDVNNTNGIYSIDNYGLWWYSDQDGQQPWASDIVSPWVPANWPSNKGLDQLRPRMFIQFGKLNPELRNSVVASMAPFQDGSNNTANTISFVDKYTGLASSTGDLLLKYAPQFGTDIVNANTTQAVVDITYNAVAGNFVKTKAPVVSSIAGFPQGGISVTQSPADSGQYVLALQTQGASGQVTSLEPENTTFKRLGTSLHSFLEFRVPTTTISDGVVGKIILPAAFPSSRSMSIILQVFGFADVSGGNFNLGFDFSYNVSTAVNGAGPNTILVANSTSINNSLLPNDTIVTGLVFPLSSTYKTNQMYVIKDSTLTIPAGNITEDSIVNFRLVRRTPASAAYPAKIGLLGVYWSLA